MRLLISREGLVRVVVVVVVVVVVGVVGVVGVVDLDTGAGGGLFVLDTVVGGVVVVLVVLLSPSSFFPPSPVSHPSFLAALLNLFPNFFIDPKTLPTSLTL